MATSSANQEGVMSTSLCSSFVTFSSRPETAGLLPLLGSRLCSSGLAGLSVPPRGALNARVQEGPSGQRPGSRLAGANCCVLPERLVTGGLLCVLGHTERLV